VSPNGRSVTPEELDMFELQTPLPELVLRCTLLYCFILAILRLANREGGQLSPVDQVVLFTVGDLIATAAIKNDDSLVAAFIAMSVFVGMSYVVNSLSYKFKPIAKTLQGAPLVLVHNGEIKWDNMEKEKISKNELMESIRAAGHLSVANVHVAMLEANGTISVISKPNNEPQRTL
jgi:uncharacterized membrane protein YcaP (DUF421 family)